MVKKKIQITSKSFDLSNIKDFHLSIQLSLDGFSFCIANKIKKEIICISQYEFLGYDFSHEKHLEYVKEVFKIEPLLQYTFESVNVTHSNLLSTLVPKSFFDENNLAAYLQYGHKVYRNDFITYDVLKGHDLVNVYIPFVNVNNYLIDTFGSFNYEHASTVVIKTLLDTYKFSEHPHMFVQVNEQDFQILTIAKNKLQLYNAFRYTNRNDFIYYVLFTAEQLQFNPNEFDLIFLGKVQKDNDIYNIAYKYVRNVSFLEIRNRLTITEEITEDLQRMFYSLLHQY